MISWLLPVLLVSQAYDVQYVQPAKAREANQEAYARYASLRIQGDKSLCILHGTAGFDLMDEERQELTLITPQADRWYYADREGMQLLGFEETMLGHAYLVKEDIPRMDWQFGKGEKIIAGFPCRQAFTAFRGREYEAWYAPSLPLPFGPWKLNGLPGLILEAQDKDQEVVFQFHAFQTIRDSTFRLEQPPAEARQVKWEEFFEAQYRDGEKFYRFLADRVQRNVERVGQVSLEMKQVGEPAFWERRTQHR